VFVKAVGLALNPDAPGMHRREGVISALLPTGPTFPSLIDVFDDGDWVALAFEAIDGGSPRHPWDPDQLAVAAQAVESVHRLLTPSPDVSVTPAAERLQWAFGGWQRLATEGGPPPGLDRWSRHHLDELVALEAGWADACGGDTLLHLDIRSDNLLLGTHGVTLVDWPHAAVGHPLLDVVVWAPSVALEGGPDPEGLIDLRPSWRGADRETLAVLVAALAGYFTHHSLLPALPGLPTLRAFQAAQGEVARAWLGRLTGW
jgi:hypothetical protein